MYLYYYVQPRREWPGTRLTVNRARALRQPNSKLILSLSGNLLKKNMCSCVSTFAVVILQAKSLLLKLSAQLTKSATPKEVNHLGQMRCKY